MLYHSAHVKLLCRSAAHEQAGSFVAWLKRVVRKEKFASVQTMFLLLYDIAVHPANADRPFGCALRSRLDLLQLEGSRAEQRKAPTVDLAGAWCYLPKATFPPAPASAGALMSGGLSVFTCVCPWETSKLSAVWAWEVRLTVSPRPSLKACKPGPSGGAVLPGWIKRRGTWKILRD